MALNNFIDKFRSVNPFFDISIKKIYGNNRSLLNFGKKYYYSLKNRNPKKIIELKQIIDYLSCYVPIRDEISIVHSAYEPFISSNISPKIIIDFLIELVGAKGTLAMPAFRKVINDEMMFDPHISEKTLIYDLIHTPVITGMLPFRLTKYKNAVISKFPINSLVAIGFFANDMMHDNLLGTVPSPHGKNSSWAFCLERNSTIIGLGTDLAQHLTMIHAIEDLNEDLWPIKNWYRNLNFKIISDVETIYKTVKERKPEWSYYFADRILCRDLIREKIMKTKTIQGVIVEHLKARDLYDYLMWRNHKGYPYFFVQKYLK